MAWKNNGKWEDYSEKQQNWARNMIAFRRRYIDHCKNDELKRTFELLATEKAPGWWINMRHIETKQLMRHLDVWAPDFFFTHGRPSNANSK
jgi:hypothetical protein